MKQQQYIQIPPKQTSIVPVTFQNPQALQGHIIQSKPQVSEKQQYPVQTSVIARQYIQQPVQYQQIQQQPYQQQQQQIKLKFVDDSYSQINQQQAQQEPSRQNYQQQYRVIQTNDAQIVQQQLPSQQYKQQNNTTTTTTTTQIPKLSNLQYLQNSPPNNNKLQQQMNSSKNSSTNSKKKLTYQITPKKRSQSPPDTPVNALNKTINFPQRYTQPSLQNTIPNTTTTVQITNNNITDNNLQQRSNSQQDLPLKNTINLYSNSQNKVINQRYTQQQVQQDSLSQLTGRTQTETHLNTYKEPQKYIPQQYNTYQTTENNVIYTQQSTTEAGVKVKTENEKKLPKKYDINAIIEEQKKRARTTEQNKNITPTKIYQQSYIKKNSPVQQYQNSIERSNTVQKNIKSLVQQYTTTTSINKTDSKINNNINKVTSLQTQIRTPQNGGNQLRQSQFDHSIIEKPYQRSNTVSQDQYSIEKSLNKFKELNTSSVQPTKHQQSQAQVVSRLDNTQQQQEQKKPDFNFIDNIEQKKRMVTHKIHENIRQFNDLQQQNGIEKNNSYSNIYPVNVQDSIKQQGSIPDLRSGYIQTTPGEQRFNTVQNNEQEEKDDDVSEQIELKIEIQEDNEEIYISPQKQLEQQDYQNVRQQINQKKLLNSKTPQKLELQEMNRQYDQYQNIQPFAQNGQINTYLSYDNNEDTSNNNNNLNINIEDGDDGARKRNPSIDSSRVVTKESTYLLKDIYNDVQSTLKKYDGIVTQNAQNKRQSYHMNSSNIINNNNLKTSNFNSQNGNNTILNSQTSNVNYDSLSKLDRFVAENQQQQRQFVQSQFQSSQSLNQQNSEMKPYIINNEVQDTQKSPKMTYSKMPQQEAEKAYQDRHKEISTQIKKIKKQSGQKLNNALNNSTLSRNNNNKSIHNGNNYNTNTSHISEKSGKNIVGNTLVNNRNLLKVRSQKSFSQTNNSAFLQKSDLQQPNKKTSNNNNLSLKAINLQRKYLSKHKSQGQILPQQKVLSPSSLFQDEEQQEIYQQIQSEQHLEKEQQHEQEQIYQQQQQDQEMGSGQGTVMEFSHNENTEDHHSNLYRNNYSSNEQNQDLLQQQQLKEQQEQEEYIKLEDYQEQQQLQQQLQEEQQEPSVYSQTQSQMQQQQQQQQEVVYSNQAEILKQKKMQVLDEIENLNKQIENIQESEELEIIEQIEQEKRQKPIKQNSKQPVLNKNTTKNRFASPPTKPIKKSEPKKQQQQNSSQYDKINQRKASQPQPQDQQGHRYSNIHTNKSKLSTTAKSKPSKQVQKKPVSKNMKVNKIQVQPQDQQQQNMVFDLTKVKNQQSPKPMKQSRSSAGQTKSQNNYMNYTQQKYYKLYDDQSIHSPVESLTTSEQKQQQKQQQQQQYQYQQNQEQQEQQEMEQIQSPPQRPFLSIKERIAQNLLEQEEQNQEEELQYEDLEQEVQYQDEQDISEQHLQEQQQQQQQQQPDIQNSLSKVQSVISQEYQQSYSIVQSQTTQSNINQEMLQSNQEPQEEVRSRKVSQDKAKKMFNDFQARNEKWMQQRQQKIQQNQQKKEKQEVQECTFKPQNKTTANKSKVVRKKPLEVQSEQKKVSRSMYQSPYQSKAKQLINNGQTAQTAQKKQLKPTANTNTKLKQKSLHQNEQQKQGKQQQQALQFQGNFAEELRAKQEQIKQQIQKSTQKISQQPQQQFEENEENMEDIAKQLFQKKQEPETEQSYDEERENNELRKDVKDIMDILSHLSQQGQQKISLQQKTEKSEKQLQSGQIDSNQNITPIENDYQEEESEGTLEAQKMLLELAQNASEQLKTVLKNTNVNELQNEN